MGATLPVDEFQKENWSDNSLLHFSSNNHLEFTGRIVSSNRKSNFMNISVECNFSGRLPTYLTTNTKWNCRLIMKLSTATREYESLTKFHDLCFSKVIQQPSDTLIIENQAGTVKFMQQLNLNFPQAAAVYKTLSQKSGFALIQGPPGTGKTKTILGIASAHLSAKGTAIIFPGQSGNSRQSFIRKKILICAPSNAAVDEICRRLMAGILNTKGVIYKPSILRIGNENGISADCLEVSLNYKIEQIIKQDLKEFSQDRENLRALEKELKSLVASNAEVEKIQQIRNDIKLVRQLNGEKGGIDVQKKKLYTEFVLESEIILATLSGSGHESLSGIPGLEFEATIIDEACQVNWLIRRWNQVLLFR